METLEDEDHNFDTAQPFSNKSQSMTSSTNVFGDLQPNDAYSNNKRKKILRKDQSRSDKKSIYVLCFLSLSQIETYLKAHDLLKGINGLGGVQ